MLLRKLRKGTARLAPEAPPKPRLQFQWWSKLLKLAARNKQVEFGTVCNLAYAFAARVPSEILRQLSWSKLSVGDNCLVYSNVYRKGKPHPCTLRRWCVCSRSPLLCWHPWLAALHELRAAHYHEAQARMFYMQLQLLARSWQGRRGILRQHMGSPECSGWETGVRRLQLRIMPHRMSSKRPLWPSNC